MEKEEVLIIDNDKRKKGKPLVKVSFTHTGDHYCYGTGQVNNYKFVTTMEYQEHFKADKTTLIEWRCVNTDKKYYSGIGLLNNICLGLVGEIKESKKLQVKGKYTFVKIGSAVLLTISKN